MPFSLRLAPVLLVALAPMAACGSSSVATPPVVATPPPAPAPALAVSPDAPALVDDAPSSAPLLVRIDRRLDGSPSWLLVLLHGYASDPTDLEPLARAIAVPPSTRVVIPAAPLEGPGIGRAWWPLDPNRIVERTRDPHVLEREDPPDLAASSALVRDLIARERGGSRVVVAGFSQGGMLAVDVALGLDPPPDALVVVAGALLARDRLSPRMPPANGMRVMIAHGRSDAVVPFAAGEVLRDAFRAAGVDVRFTAYDGGHSAEPPAIEDVERFVYELSGTASTL